MIELIEEKTGPKHILKQKGAWLQHTFLVVAEMGA